ncbi:hypothetical protein IFM89_039429 [Coptis chinensis]|uniref:Receptor-like serine/threonine-protein kinase n=1 Tax=Coptis chinensis TaxID=261450 RepID=A0A835IKL9_9MAGN|nr:hypothetical protein IFM89_039429 [Coptis chinensis]
MSCLAQIKLGTRLVAGDNQAWVSANQTFAFGFTPFNSKDQFKLAIWYAQLPGDRVIVWSANRTYLSPVSFSLTRLIRNSPVGKDATLELDTSGNLVLIDQTKVVWASNTSDEGVGTAAMSESGNLVLYNSTLHPVWQSFSHPLDTLLPGQALSVSLELTSSKLPSHGGYYTLKLLQQATSLSLGLTYNSPDSYNDSPEFYSNYSYWSGPEVSNVTGNVTALLDDNGNFGIVYGSSSEGIVYVHKNDVGNGGSSTGNKPISSSALHRLTIEANGNLRLYRWDNDVNGSQQWVPEWAAVSNPCDIAGTCGNGICNLDATKTNATCTCLPGTSQVPPGIQCSENSLVTANCDPSHGNSTSQYKITTVLQTNYHYSDLAVIANYSDISTSSRCGDACLSDCECAASVYGLQEETTYCWILSSLKFGGFQDPGSTLFVKVGKNYSSPTDTSRPRKSPKESRSTRNKVLVLPIVLCMSVLIGLLCFLLYYSFYRRRFIVKAIKGALTVSGAPLNFKYRDLQSATTNFTQLLGTGGFGSVFKGTLADGTLVAVKKLERFLPHGEKEFITEVNTIGSMHHMNLVRLCGFCSEGSHRLLEMTQGTPIHVVDKRLLGVLDEDQLVRAMQVAFWCIQDEVWMRPSMGEVVMMLDGSVEINPPPMPPTVLELVEEGLEHVYKAMKREYTHSHPAASHISYSYSIATHPSSQATCSYSTMSPR